MRIKKIAFILAAVLCLSVFAGCSKKEELERGTVNGASYSNASLGISFEAPEGWGYMTDDEMLSYYGDDYSEIPNGDQLAEADMVYDMLAYSSDQIETVSINFENLGKLYGTVLDEAAYLDIADDKVKEQFETMGYTDVKIDAVSTTNIGGSEFHCLSIEIVIPGTDVSIFEELMVRKVGSWMGVVTVTSLSEEGVAALVSCMK